MLLLVIVLVYTVCCCISPFLQFVLRMTVICPFCCSVPTAPPIVLFMCSECACSRPYCCLVVTWVLRSTMPTGFFAWDQTVPGLLCCSIPPFAPLVLFFFRICLQFCCLVPISVVPFHRPHCYIFLSSDPKCACCLHVPLFVCCSVPPFPPSVIACAMADYDTLSRGRVSFFTAAFWATSPLR